MLCYQPSHRSKRDALTKPASLVVGDGINVLSALVRAAAPSPLGHLTETRKRHRSIFGRRRAVPDPRRLDDAANQRLQAQRTAEHDALPLRVSCHRAPHAMKPENRAALAAGTHNR